MVSIPDNFLCLDVTVDGTQHLLFVTDLQLGLFEKVKTWYVDTMLYISATFHC